MWTAAPARANSLLLEEHFCCKYLVEKNAQLYGHQSNFQQASTITASKLIFFLSNTEVTDEKDTSTMSATALFSVAAQVFSVINRIR